MRIAVAADICTGHGRCYVVSPGLFSDDEEGYCAQRGTEFEVTEELQPAATLAAESCPERAIRIIAE
jgi:ferredoxin